MAPRRRSGSESDRCSTILDVGETIFGRKPMNDRKVLTGIIFVLRTGIPSREMLAELGCGSGMTCHCPLKLWHRKGVFHKFYEVLLALSNQESEPFNFKF